MKTAVCRIAASATKYTEIGLDISKGYRLQREQEQTKKRSEKQNVNLEVGN